MAEGDAEEDGDNCVNDKSLDNDKIGNVKPSEKQLSIFNSVSLGLYHGLAVSRDKGVYTWGSIWHNAMGLGIENGEAKEPVKIPFFEDKSALQVSCGDSHSAVLVAADSSYSGYVYTFGLGDGGRLGYHKGGQSSAGDESALGLDIINDAGDSNENTGVLDDEKDANTSEIKRDTKTKKMQLNRQVSLEEVLRGDALSSRSNQQSWFSSRPFKVKLKLKVKQISCGSAHTLVICEDLSLWSWGCGNFGVLGLGFDYNISEPMQIKLDNVTHVSAGSRHSLAISNNSLYSWGYGANGRLGLYHSKNVYHPNRVNGKGLETVLYVSAGQSHSACINSEGELFTWGSGQGGRLGHSWSANGDLNYPHQLSIPGTSFQSISCGMAHTIALTEDGRIYFWGTLTSKSNTPQQIPLGAKTISVNAGPYGAAFITCEGDLATWGIGGYYRLGHSTHEDYINPTFIPSLKDCVGLFKAKQTEFKASTAVCHVIDVESGESHALALANDGSVYSWGRSLGTGAKENFACLSTPERLTFKARVTAISCGRDYCMALVELGIVYSWGSNKYGQLGIGDLMYRIEPTMIDSLKDVLHIKACIDSSSAIVCVSEEYRDAKVGNLMVWGNANNYKLGLGKDVSSGLIMSPMSVECEELVFNVEIGENHSMIVSQTGKVYISGGSSIATGYKNCYNFTYMPIIGDDGEPETAYQALPGANHSAVLTTSGYVYLWGKGLSVCSTKDVSIPLKFDCLPNRQPVKYLNVSGNMTCAITIDGKCWYWGSSARETIYSPTELKGVKNISLEKLNLACDFGVGLNPYQIVYTWGKNDFGQLGRGYDGQYDSDAKIVQIIKSSPISQLNSIDRESQIEHVIVHMMSAQVVEWDKVFEIVKFEPFRQREVFLYTTELSIIKSLQRVLSVLLNDSCDKLNALYRKRSSIVEKLYGCKNGVIENFDKIIQILYLQPAYLLKLMLMDSQAALEFVSLLYSKFDDEYTCCLLMALHRLLVSAELISDLNFPNTIKLIKLVNNTGFNYKIPKDFKTTDLISLVESFPLNPLVEKMLYYTLFVFKRHFLSVEAANTHLIKLYFALVIASVDNQGQATSDEYRKKCLYDAILRKINELPRHSTNYNLQYQLTSGLFKMHLYPGEIAVKVPCSLAQRLYQVALQNLNNLNLSVHDPLVEILTRGLKHPHPCDGCQCLYIDRRFLVADKNLSLCTYSNVPVPQRLAYRQSSHIDVPPSEDMRRIYDLEDVKNSLDNCLPHRMLSPIYRYQQPSRNDPKWLLQQSFRVIKRLNTADTADSTNESSAANTASIVDSLGRITDEFVDSKEFLKASLLEETAAALSSMDGKQLVRLVAEMLEMQQRRSVHYRYLSLILESQKKLVEDVSLYKYRVDEEMQRVLNFINSKNAEQTLGNNV